MFELNSVYDSDVSVHNLLTWQIGIDVT